MFKILIWDDDDAISHGLRLCVGVMILIMVISGDFNLHACNNSTIVGQVFIIFIMDVTLFDANPKSHISVSYNR
jgi:hypothetical protein